MIQKYILIFVFIGLLGCNEYDFKDDSNVRFDPEFIMKLNSQSVDTLKLDSKKYILEAYLWRDFMPISPPNGRALVAINWLIDLDSTDISTNLDLVEQYVIYNDSVWIVPYENGTHTQHLYKLEKISINGPKWGPKIYVDVISKIHNSNTHINYYLRLEDVYIGRTD